MSADDESILAELAALPLYDSPEAPCSFLDGKEAPWVIVVDVQCPHSPYPVCVAHADLVRSKIGYNGYCSQCSQRQQVKAVERK